MRYAARRDSSHRSIADALRQIGADVLEGFDCDLYVRFRDRPFLIECKDRENVQSRRTGGIRKGGTTSKQQRLKAIFGSQYIIAYDIQDALLALGVNR